MPLTVNDAIESRAFYALEFPVRVLHAPIPILEQLGWLKFDWIWQIVTKTAPELAMLGITPEQIAQLETLLAEHSLSLGMELDGILVRMLTSGHVLMEGSDLVSYFRDLKRVLETTGTSERTRWLVEREMHGVSNRIIEERRRYLGRCYHTYQDIDGLPAYVDAGIVTF